MNWFGKRGNLNHQAEVCFLIGVNDSSPNLVLKRQVNEGVTLVLCYTCHIRG